MVYSYEGGFEANKWDRLYFDLATTFCGSHFNEELKNNGERKKAIWESYIHKYDIDMSIYKRTSYTEFNTVNDWFTRKLRTPQEVRHQNPTKVYVGFSWKNC